MKALLIFHWAYAATNYCIACTHEIWLKPYRKLILVPSKLCIFMNQILSDKERALHPSIKCLIKRQFTSLFKLKNSCCTPITLSVHSNAKPNIPVYCRVKESKIFNNLIKTFAHNKSLLQWVYSMSYLLFKSYSNFFSQTKINHSCGPTLILQTS